jgi:ankyrin repeat protein
VILLGFNLQYFDMLECCLHNSLQGDPVMQAICAQLFAVAGVPFSLAHFGPRIGVSFHRRLEWLCNGSSSGSLTALNYIRHNTFERQETKDGLGMLMELLAFTGLPDTSIRWERAYEKEANHPLIYSINQFRAGGGYNSHYIHSTGRLTPLVSLGLRNEDGQYGVSVEDSQSESDIWQLDDVSILTAGQNPSAGEPVLSIPPFDLPSSIGRIIRSFQSKYGTRLDSLILRGGCGDSLIHCLAALAQTEDFVRAGSNIVYTRDISSVHPLMRCLQHQGFDINQQNDHGETALWQACASGHASTAIELLKSGADPDIPNICGVFPMHWLFQFLNHEIDALLAAFKERGLKFYDASVNTSMPSLHFPFEWPRGTPLHWAICAGAHRAVSALLCLGADVDKTINIGDGRTMSALDIATSRYLHPIVKILIEHGAHVKNAIKWIVADDTLPLWLSQFPTEEHHIFRSKAFYTVAHLMELDPHEVPVETQFSAHSPGECVRLDTFIEAIDDAFNRDSQTALHALGRARSLLRLCCWRKSTRVQGLSKLRNCLDLSIPLSVFRYFSKGEIGLEDLRIRDYSGGSIVHYTAGWSHPTNNVQPKYLWYLMENGGSMHEFVEGTSETALSLLIKNAVADQQSFVLKVCRELVSNQFYRDESPAAYFYLTGTLPPDQTDQSGFKLTALHHAILAGNLDATMVFLENGHAVNTPTADGLYPLDLVKDFAPNLRHSFIRALKSFGSRDSTNITINAWRPLTIGGQQCYFHLASQSLTLVEPVMDLFAARSLRLGWRENYHLHEIVVDMQRLFPSNKNLIHVVEKSVLERNNEDPQELHRVTAEQGVILAEEKRDRLVLYELKKEEKFYSAWNIDLREYNIQSRIRGVDELTRHTEIIYSAFKIQQAPVTPESRQPILRTGPYANGYEIRTLYPIGWKPDPVGPALFYTSGVYNDFHGFKFENEQDARQQFLWEHLGSQVTGDMIDQSETGRLELPARGQGKGMITWHLPDDDEKTREPRDRTALPLKFTR